MRNRQRPHRNQFAGLRADNRHAHNLTFCRGDDFYMAMRFTLGLGAIVVVIGPSQNAHLEAALARLGLAEPGLRQFRIGADQ